jgi:raffinose/stachyose/melibiose transport system permease protein
LSISALRRPTPAVILHYWVVITIVAGMAFPLVWMLYSAFKTNQEIALAPLGLPSVWRWQNLVEAWNLGQLGRLYLNSLLVTSVSVTAIVLLLTGTSTRAGSGTIATVAPAFPS